jgi:hypothetical protein
MLKKHGCPDRITPPAARDDGRDVLADTNLESTPTAIR